MRLVSIAAALTVCLAATIPALGQQQQEESDGGSAPEASTEAAEPRSSAAEQTQQSTPQTPSAQHFTLEVCNATRRPAFVAVSSREQPTSREWYVMGWWNVAAGQCRSVGRFPKSNIFLHAEAPGGGRWNGRDVSICVEKQKFKRIAMAGYKCARPQLRGFYKKTITADKFTWRLTASR
jgi:uncharacterized membrane protein